MSIKFIMKIFNFPFNTPAPSQHSLFLYNFGNHHVYVMCVFQIIENILEENENGKTNIIKFGI